MIHTRTFKTIDDLGLLLENGELIRPISWSDLLQNLPKNWKDTHSIFSVETTYDLIQNDVGASVGVLIESEEDFNLEFLLGSAFVIVETSKVADSIIEIDKPAQDKSIFALILTFPFYQPTSSVQFEKCLPLNWEKSYDIYALAGYQDESGTYIKKPVLLKTWKDVKLYMLFEEEFFILVPKSRTNDMNRLMKAYEELQIQSPITSIKTEYQN